MDIAQSMSLSSKLSQRLAYHVRNVDLNSLSRIPQARLEERALPNTGLIELVSAEDFTKLYDALYISMFPHQAERERSDLITDRLQKEFAGQRRDLAPYRVVGIRDHDGKAIGAAQFSVLLLPGRQYAVPYLQYLYIRIESRRQDMAEVLHTMVLAVATADAEAHDNRSVPFTLFETEPAGHGEDGASQAVATQRAMIHTKTGAVAIMLRRESDGATSSPHVQPGLEIDDPPLSLVWAIRRSPAMIAQVFDVDVKNIGEDLIAAYYQSLRDEGFPEPNIRLAESVVTDRCRDHDFVLMALGEVVLPKDSLRNLDKY